MKSAIEIDVPPTNISHITFASTASSAAVDSDEQDRGGHVLTDRGVDPAGDPERAGVDLRAEPAPQGAEHVAPHADRGRDEHDEPGKQVEGVTDRGEGDAGDEIAARGDQERDEARPDSGDVRAEERDEARADTTRGAGHEELGGSAIWSPPEPVKATPSGVRGRTDCCR